MCDAGLLPITSGGHRIGLLLDTIAGSLALFIDEEKVKCWEEMGMTGSFRWAVIMHGVEEAQGGQEMGEGGVCSGAGSVTIGAEKDAPASFTTGWLPIHFNPERARALAQTRSAFNVM